MTKKDRVINIIFGIATLVYSAYLIVNPDSNYRLIINLIVLFLLFHGISQLFYFFTMARFMVGGLLILFKGIFFLDFTIFLYSLNSVPRRILLLYLIGMLAVAGLIDFLQALDKRKTKISRIYNFATGTIRILIGITAMFSRDSATALTELFCITLLSYSVTRFVEAFKKSAIVYLD